MIPISMPKIAIFAGIGKLYADILFVNMKCEYKNCKDEMAKGRKRLSYELKSLRGTDQPVGRCFVPTGKHS